MSDAKKITFEEGYRRLQEIADQVNSAEVPVDKMAALFAEGRGLDKALTDHLNEQKTRIESIEKGEGIQVFEIVPPADDAKPEADQRSDTPVSEVIPTEQSPSEDDIPF